MKNNKIIYCAIALLGLTITSCDFEKAGEEVDAPQSTNRYPTPTFTFTGQTTIDEATGNQTLVYDVVTDRLTDQPLEFSFIQTGGTATEHDDYDVTKATVPAFTNTGQLTVVIYKDLVLEGTETLQLTIIPGPAEASAYLPNPNTVYPTLSLTIQDYIFCSWTLETSDTYGDGWQGGMVEVVSEGVTTTYFPDGVPMEVFEIAISDGADYTFTYLSGGGTGGAPGYENENYYKLTSPDGTMVFEDGTMDYSGIPTPGLITSGTNNCQ